MKVYSASDIRNIALIGHQDTGKTSLAEAILFNTGVVNRIGRVDDGTTHMDTAPEEIHRKISIQTALAGVEFNKNKINILDTPGYEDFVGEVYCSLDVVEAAVMLVRADAGAEVGTEKLWTKIRDEGKPTIICVNKMDKDNVSFDTLISGLQHDLGAGVVPFQLPIGSGASFKGVVDLMHGKAYEYATDGKGTFEEVAVPADLADQVDAMRKAIFEAAAENDEALMEKYLETETLTDAEAAKGLLAGVAAGDLYPLFLVSAEKNIGIPQFLQGVIDVVPSPAQLPKKLEDGELEADPKGTPAAMVFKNVSESHLGDMLFVRVYRGTLTHGGDIYNATRDSSERLGQLYHVQGKGRVDTHDIAAGDIGAAVKLKHSHIGDSLSDKSHPIKLPRTVYPRPSIFSSITAVTKGDEDKIGHGLNRLKEEDPTFEVRVDGEVHQTLISGQGELHLDIITGRLKSRFGVDVVLSKPRIPYKETIKRAAEAQGKHKKQTGGRGQYGDAWLKLEPLPRGSGFEFVDGIVGGVVPNKFIPAVEKGVKETMERGVIAGYNVVDVRATLYDGSYHNVDSSEAAFKMAASMAFKKAAMSATMILLEPIYTVTVKVPEEFMGDVMGDLSGRRGKIQGTEATRRHTIITALVPQGELYRYSTHLRSMSQGRGTHKREFSHYEEVPHDAAVKIIEEAKKEKEAAA